MNKAIVWTIAGSDSGGGAGIQADLHVFQGLGVHGCSVITAVTAQNTHAVTDIHYIPADQVAAQIASLKADLPPQAIKIGMLGDTAAVAAVSDFLGQYSGKVVLDPVMIAGSGDNLFVDTTAARIRLLQHIFPLVDLVTPNLREAESLVGFSLSSYQAITEAAQKILAMGAKSVLIKGGHFAPSEFSQDYWTNGVEAFWLSSPRIMVGGIHGAGCTLSSAIAAVLALGYEIKEALILGKMYVNRAIRLAQKCGAGLAPVAHGHWPEAPQDLPFACLQPMIKLPPPFLACAEIGVYPLLENSICLEKLLPLKINTFQLRIKNKMGLDLEEEVKKAVLLAQQYSTNLFVNDYWDLAIKYAAYGVHLGQEDLTPDAVELIRDAGLRLGVSTHNYYELAVAHALNPSYIALGPLFPTSNKLITSAPVGIDGLRRWRQLTNTPLVAIGGISLEQIPAVIAAGADGIAVIGAITQNENPVAAAREFVDCFTRNSGRVIT